MSRGHGPRSPGWPAFLCNYTAHIAGIDLFVVPTIGFKLLYGLVILGLERRRLVWTNVTANPTAEWIAQQISEAFPWDEAPRYFIRDRDTSYGAAVTRRLHAMGIPSLRAGEVELAVTGRGQFAAKLTRIEFHRLWIQRFSDSLPRIVHIALISRRATVQFLPIPGPSLFVAGLEIGPTHVLRHSLEDDFYRTPRSIRTLTSWACTSVIPMTPFCVRASPQFCSISRPSRLWMCRFTGRCDACTIVPVMSPAIAEAGGRDAGSLGARLPAGSGPSWSGVPDRTP